MKLHFYRFIVLFSLSLGCLSAGAQQFYFKEYQRKVPPYRGSDDRFALTNAVSGNYAICSDHQHDLDPNGSNYLSQAGAAVIYEKDANGYWQYHQTLVASDRRSNDLFGLAVGIDSNIAVVSAPTSDYDASGTNFKESAGAVYVFERQSNGKWVQIQKLVASDRNTNHNFGWGLDISGDNIFVAAIKNSTDASGSNSVSEAGAGYIFTRNSSGKFVQKQKIVTSDRNKGDQLGRGGIKIWGKYAAAASIFNDRDKNGSNVISDAGACYLFEENSSGTWVQVAKLVSPYREGSAYFGEGPKLDSNRLIVSSAQSSKDSSGGNSISKAGQAYSYMRDKSGNWNLEEILVAPVRRSNALFGRTTIVSGKLLIVGSMQEGYDYNNSNFLSNAGAAYFYVLDSNGYWKYQQKISASDRKSGDLFGRPAMDGENLVIGAYGQAYDSAGNNYISQAGKAYFYKYCERMYDTLDTAACDVFVSPSGNYIWSASGTYLDTIPTSEGCDSVITINLTIHRKQKIIEIIRACESFTWINGKTYTSRIYGPSVTYADQYGCDSTIVLDLTILPPKRVNFVVTACDSFKWINNGKTYYASNYSDKDTLKTSEGCDSIVTLNLTVFQSSHYTDVVTACNSYKWIDGVTYYANTKDPSITYTNVDGCDSVVTLDLTIHKEYNLTENRSACDSFTWSNGVTYFSSVNGVKHRMTSQYGCDSTLTLNLEIKNSTTGTDRVVACNSYRWMNGKTYTASNNTDVFILTNSAGCDSIVTLDLTINPTVYGIDTIEACDRYTWTNGVTYFNSTNTPKDTFISSVGCDSIVTLDLTINKQQTITVQDTGCRFYISPTGEYEWKTSGTYYDTLPSSKGCDSILRIELTIVNIDTSLSVKDSLVISNQDNAFYQWMDCDGNEIPGKTGQNLFAPENGMYRVKIDQYGCSDTSECAEIDYYWYPTVNQNNICSMIYPNPTRGGVTVDIGDREKVESIVVYDMNGQKVEEIDLEDSSPYSFYLEDARSMYLVKVVTTAGTFYCKIIRQ